MSLKIKREILELKILLRSVPSPILTLFAVSVILMNLLASKSISLPVSWLALDCGITVSWISFLSMDIIVRHFGPKAATEISLIAAAINLLTCVIFHIAGAAPGMWGQAYASGNEALINGALNKTISGTWYVLLGSTIAFIASAVVNNFTNSLIGGFRHSKPESFSAYARRSYISTAVGQFTDNFIFALLVSHFFFGWTMLQCITCSLTGMAIELLCEVIFSPLGYIICKSWRLENVGAEYFLLKKEQKAS